MAKKQTSPGYEYHDYANLFPLAEGQPLAELAADIQANGQAEPIMLFGGKILDGRRRDLACLKAGVEAKYAKFKGTEAEALAWVISKNLHRRHLDESQRAMVAAKVANLGKGRPELNAQNCAFNSTQEEAAKSLNVSKRSVQNAATVQKNGTPALVQSVESGHVSVHDAASVAKEPPEVQNAAVEAVKTGTATTARQAVERNGKHEEKEELKDADGELVPERVVDAFEQAREMQQWCRDIGQLINRAKDFAKGAGGRCIRLEAVKQQLEDAKGNIWANRPTHICPYCRAVEGADCQVCKGQGWVPKHIWEQAPGKNKRAVRA